MSTNQMRMTEDHTVIRNYVKNLIKVGSKIFKVFHNTVFFRALFKLTAQFSFIFRITVHILELLFKY